MITAAIVGWRNKFLSDKSVHNHSENFDEQIY
jgi:hypothetical protein